MFEITHQLAQDIVDRAMTILPHNVNVMDSQGLILGSGEKKRINTRHEGAQLVLANHRTVEIDEQAAENLKGVQPGINLPLMHDNELVGVLGISGDPKSLRIYAELVRMTAEMLVDQNHMQSDRTWRKQRCSDVIAALLGEAGASQRLIDEAHQLGLKPGLERIPCLIEAGSGSSVSSMQHWLSEQYTDSWSVEQSSDIVLWCCPTSYEVDPLRLIARLERYGWNVERIAYGIPAANVHELRRGCHRIAELLNYGRSFKPQIKNLSLAKYRLHAFLWGCREESAVQELLEPLVEIQARDGNGQLLRTLKSWCLNDGHPQLCADELGIHRNSLRYRLDRIAEVRGKDVGRLSDVVELYLGLLIFCDDTDSVG